MKNLIKANLIIQHATKRSHYTLPPPLLLSGLESDGMGLDSDEIGRESDAMGLNPYDKGLKSDNNTHYKTFLKPFEGPLDKFQLQTEAEPPTPADLNTEKTKQCNGEIINGIGCADPMDARKNTNTLLKYSDVVKNDEKLSPELDDQSSFVRAPYNLMCRFVETLSAEEIIRFRDIADNDDLLNALNMTFEAFCLELCKGSESFRATYSLLHMTGLGMLVRSLRQLSGKEVGHPIQALNRKIYPLMLAMYQIVDAHQEAIFQLKCESELNKAQEEYFKSWETLPELIRKQLDYPNLAPAEKMRLLKRIIREFNEKGFLKGITIHLNVLNGTTNGYKLAEEFFKMNEEMTVNEVVSILFNCADAHLEPTSEDGGYDKKWHARKGTDLHFFFRNIEQINNELNMGHKFFKIKYLPN